MFTFIMIAGFFAVIWMGPLAMLLLVLHFYFVNVLQWLESSSCSVTSSYLVGICSNSAIETREKDKKYGQS